MDAGWEQTSESMAALLLRGNAVGKSSSVLGRKLLRGARWHVA